MMHISRNSLVSQHLEFPRKLHKKNANMKTQNCSHKIFFESVSKRYFSSNDPIEDKKITKVEDIIRLSNRLKDGEFYLWSKDEKYNPNAPKLTYPFGLWSRGEGQSNWKLTPNIWRDNDSKYIDEHSLIRHFQAVFSSSWQEHKTTFEWLTLMQHYMAASRLLDWSENLLTSLYFAVENEKDHKEDGAIWILNAGRLNRLATLHLEDTNFENQSDDSSNKWGGIASPKRFDVVVRSEMSISNTIEHLARKISVLSCDEFDAPKLDQTTMYEFLKKKEVKDKLMMPIAVYPIRYNNRLKAQSGVFTLHGGKKYYRVSHLKDDHLPSYKSLEEINDEYKGKNSEKLILEKFIVPSSFKKEIKTTLFELGVHEGSIYVEFEDRGRVLRRFWET